MTAPAEGPARTLLLVDDDDDVAAALTRVLQRHGFVVHRARTGSEAIGMLATAPDFDAAVVDLVLPGAGGLTVVAEVRRASPRCRIVAVTGVSGTSTIESAFLSAGADCFLTKPVERADLLAALDAKPV